MPSQFLFAYGTLKSDQPEHLQHAEAPISVQAAKAPGNLWRLREGYPILQIDPAFCLLDAGPDLVADWVAALERSRGQPPAPHEGAWIHGELFEYPLTPDILNRMDEWEAFVPGRKSAYQRRAIWLKDQRDRDQVAWAYVCYTPPNWATLLAENTWNRNLS